MLTRLYRKLFSKEIKEDLLFCLEDFRWSLVYHLLLWKNLALFYWKKVLLVSVIGVLGISLGLYQYLSISKADYLDSRDYVVKIIVPNMGYGSGVFVGKNKIVTAFHIVGDKTRVEILVNDKIHKGIVIKRHERRDLALIRVENYSQEQYLDPPEDLDNLSFLDNVWSVGYPLAVNKMVTYGTYQGRTDRQVSMDPTDLVLFEVVTSPVALGSSGGAVLAKINGKILLVGIVSGMGFKLGDYGAMIFPSIVYVVPGPDIYKFLQ